MCSTLNTANTFSIKCSTWNTERWFMFATEHLTCCSQFAEACLTWLIYVSSISKPRQHITAVVFEVRNWHIWRLSACVTLSGNMRERKYRRWKYSNGFGEQFLITARPKWMSDPRESLTLTASDIHYFTTSANSLWHPQTRRQHNIPLVLSWVWLHV